MLALLKKFCPGRLGQIIEEFNAASPSKLETVGHAFTCGNLVRIGLIIKFANAAMTEFQDQDMVAAGLAILERMKNDCREMIPILEQAEFPGM